MKEYLDLMKGWEFTKSNVNQTLFGIKDLNITDDYTLKVISNMRVGHVVILKGYALKRLK